MAYQLFTSPQFLMRLCRILPRIGWTVATVALAISLQGITSKTAYASCGDWLDHAGRLSLPQQTQQDSPLVPQCRGPQCQGNSLPISLPDQRVTAPSNDLSAVLAAFSQHLAISVSKCSSLDCCSLLPGHRERIERPPRSV